LIVDRQQLIVDRQQLIVDRQQLIVDRQPSFDCARAFSRLDYISTTQRTQGTKRNKKS
jgi:hypothetical protein